MAWATVLAIVTLLVPASGPVAAGSASAPRPAGQAADEEAGVDPALLLVLDVSGSMSDSDGTGTPKIDGAKRSITGLLGTLESTIRIGLNTFPGGSDCDDGTSPFAIDAANRTDMDRYVRGVEVADGGTPMAAALQKAGQDLERAGEPRAVVVLVSDGENTCDGDPCAVAGDLAASGIDITVDTVGFQISDAGREELQCIADATGGTYVDVEDADALTDQIRSEYVPEIDLDIEYAEQASLEAGTDNSVAVTATISNVGRVTAPDVEATITYDTSLAPAESKPRRRLGNLAPGEERKVTWTIRPTDAFADKDVTFTVRAFTRDAETPERRGTIHFQRDLDPDALPGWLRDADHLVVLGDSYSSGEGLAGTKVSDAFAYDPPTDSAYNSCHRANDGNVGGRLAALVDRGQEVTTLACSGAVIADLWTDSKTRGTATGSSAYHRADGTREGDPLPSQIDQLEDLDDPADLVLMTIGGNDARFSTLVLRCLLVLDCASSDMSWLGGSGAESVQAALGPMGGRLETAYRAVQQAASDRAGRSVPVVVLAYPLAFPSPGQPCSSAGRAFTASNRRFLNDVAARFNRLASEAAERLRADGYPVWFVDTTAATNSNGHTYCDADPWINVLDRGAVGDLIDNLDGGVAEKLTGTQWLAVLAHLRRPAESRAWKNLMHPTADGYRVEADLVATWAMTHPDLAVAAPKKDDTTTTTSGGGGGADPGPDPTVVATEVHEIADTPSSPDRTVSITGDGPIQLAPSETVLVTADGFAPGSEVEFRLVDDPGRRPSIPVGGADDDADATPTPSAGEPLGTGTVDEDGSVRVPITVRPDYPGGRHRLVATGLAPDGTDRTVARPVSVQRPLPTWWAVGLIGTGVLGLGSIGTGTWALLRRRRIRRQLPPRSRGPRRRRKNRQQGPAASTAPPGMQTA